MFKFLLIFALALAPCSCLKPRHGISGVCPKLPVTVPSTTLKGDVYIWAYNLFGGPKFPTEPCKAQKLDIVQAINNIQILGTDNKNYIVIYFCMSQRKEHVQYTITYTSVKFPSEAVVKAIKKAHTDNKLDITTLVNDCK